MNKEELKNKIAEILGIGASEKDLAFEMVLKNLSKILNFDEAINIPNIGVFSIKKEPILREERKEKTSSSSKRNLIFLPDEMDSKTSSKSMYLTFNLDESSDDYLEFDENVFSISVGKPVVSANGIQEGNPISGNSERMLTTLEEKVQRLVSNTEKISDYDIWNEFALKDGNKENEDDTLNIVLPDEDLKLMVSENVEGEGLPESELANELEVENDISSEDDSSEDVDLGIVADESNSHDEQLEENTSSEEEQVKVDEPSKNSENNEDINWDWGDELKEELETDASANSKEPEEKISKTIDGPVTDNTEAGKNSKTPDIFEAINDAKEEQEGDASNEENKESEEVENDQDIADEKETDEDQINHMTHTVEYSPEYFEKKHSEKSKIEDIMKKFKFGKTFWILVSAFVLIAIFGIYFLFFSSSETLEIKPGAVPDTLIHRKLQPVEGLASKQNTTSSSSDKNNKANKAGVIGGDTKSIEKKNLETPQVKNTETNREVNSGSNSLYRTFPDEKQIRNLIFLQNGVYSLQVSSRRSKIKAEQYVKKLRNVGYNAFIVKTYLSKLKSTWYRVRIGFFKTEKEAIDFRVKNKF